MGPSRCAAVFSASLSNLVPPRLRFAARTGAVLVAAVGIPFLVTLAWVPVRKDNPSVDVALALMVVITLAGAAGRRDAVVAAALSAATVFTYFDTAPYDHFAITRGPDVVTAILLVVVGLVSGELAIRVARQRRADRTGGDMGRVRRAATSLAAGDELVMMIGSVADELTRLLDLGGCWFASDAPEPGIPCVTRGGRLDGASSDGPASGAVRRWTGEVILPVWGQGQILGHFVLQMQPAARATQQQLLVAVTLADQVGAALFAQAPPPVPSGPRPDDPKPGLHVVR